jgi:chitin disaccharide deacetylase
VVRRCGDVRDSGTYLIVNADDFGLSRGVNRGIVEAHERGIVTSASLMVKRDGAAEAAAYARGRPELDVGLHVELEQAPGRFPWRWPAGKQRSRAAVAADVRAQLDRFRRLLGTDPTHIDSHHHRHRQEPTRSVLAELANRLGMPLRELDPRIRFCGDFYGQLDGRPWPEGIRPKALIELLEELQPGLTELCSHPGYADDVRTGYRSERAVEVRTLCDPAVWTAIHRLGIRLIGFRDLARIA